MRAVVTGAGGFIGSYMVDLLLKEGWNVIATDLPQKLLQCEKKKGVKFISADITNPSSLLHLFKNKVDYFFHFAAIFDFSAPMDLLKKVNVDGTENLCKLCAEKGIKRFVLISTGGVYGFPLKEFLPIREDHPKNPRNNYEKSKLLQEEVALKYHKEQNLPVTIIRPGGVVYGAGNFYGAYDILKLLSLFKIAPVIENIKNRVAFVNAEDIARSALFLATREDTNGEAFNVGDGTAYTQYQFIEGIGNLIGAYKIKLYIPEMLLKLVVPLLYKILSPLAMRIYPRKLLFEPDTIFYILNDYYFSSEKIFNLGFKPKYPDVLTGIVDFVEWFKNKGKKRE